MPEFLFVGGTMCVLETHRQSQVPHFPAPSSSDAIARDAHTSRALMLTRGERKDRESKRDLQTPSHHRGGARSLPHQVAAPRGGQASVTDRSQRLLLSPPALLCCRDTAVTRGGDRRPRRHCL